MQRTLPAGRYRTLGRPAAKPSRDGLPRLLASALALGALPLALAGWLVWCCVLPQSALGPSAEALLARGLACLASAGVVIVLASCWLHAEAQAELRA